jgi:hypothetical protein
MTKTTNFEISKKLAEIKFNKETNFYYRKTDKELFINTPPDLKDSEKFFLKSYDLETLLEFAFNYISDFKIFYNGVFVAEYWNDGKYEVIDELLVDRELSFKSVNGKVIREYKYNYAEIVAKLIILLHEKNLIKF